jgi:RNA polymerase sigma-70 factor (ECF subfamily)
VSAYGNVQPPSLPAAWREPDPVGSGAPTRADLAGLFARHAGDIFRYGASRVGHSAAEDVVAETFLLAHQRWHRFDPDRGTPSAWLYGIATNVLRRHRRDEVRALRALARTGVDPLLDDNMADQASARVDATAQARRVSAALAALPTRQREVLMLYAIAQLAYAEIAAALDIPLGSVQSALYRARTKVRAALTDANAATDAKENAK